jgi:2'-5' RNA ligase
MKMIQLLACIPLVFGICQAQHVKPIYLAPIGKGSPFQDYQGSMFAAVQVPANIQKKIGTLQNQIHACVGKSFSPAAAQNLHITLQLVGQVSTVASLKAYTNVLHSVAKRHTPWNLAKHMENVRITISKTGVVMVTLPRSDTLFGLATDIRNSFHQAGLSYDKRFDFPYGAHITIGHIDKNAIKTLKTCLKKRSIIPGSVLKAKHFHINEFVFLKSNNPHPKRHYAIISSYTL